MVAERPVDPELLGEMVDLDTDAAEQACVGLAEAYEREGRGFGLKRVAGGWRYQTHSDMAAYVERFVLEGQSSRLSAAALETLAIVAYKQPLSRAQVASIRGVNVDGVVRTLLNREYLCEVGRDPGPGQAVLYGTTDSFLERLGLDSLADLPALAEFVPGADVVEALERGLRSGIGDATTEVDADTNTDAESHSNELADASEADDGVEPRPSMGQVDPGETELIDLTQPGIDLTQPGIDLTDSVTLVAPEEVDHEHEVDDGDVRESGDSRVAGTSAWGNRQASQDE